MTVELPSTHARENNTTSLQGQSLRRPAEKTQEFFKKALQKHRRLGLVGTLEECCSTGRVWPSAHY